MPLNANQALGSQIREWSHAGKTHHKTFLKFSCSECGADLWVANNKRDLQKHLGRCRPCSRKLSSPPIKRLRPFEWLYNHIVHTAKMRVLPHSLTYEEFLKFTKVQACHYCTSPVTWRPHCTHNRYGRQCNLDRKDSDRGYHVENLVVCCTMCNRIKNSILSYEDMMLLSPTLRQILPQKTWVDRRRNRLVKKAGV